MTMDVPSKLLQLRDELRAELTGNILPFWMTEAVDERYGGFAGWISNDGIVREEAPKGGILNARILWTFSAAFRALDDDRYRRLAGRAKAYLDEHIWDDHHGGIYWMVGHSGTPLDERKHVYAQAFAVYAYSEHHRATGDAASLERAVELYRLIERHAHDDAHGGYHEAFSRDWKLLDDVRLSEKDADERKSMNTHLHLLEAYANLYRVWRDAELEARLRELVDLFLGVITEAKTAHLVTFFDEDWEPKSDEISFGHDIEASWLVLEAADVLRDHTLRERVQELSLRTARAVLEEGIDADGGLMYEAGPHGLTDTDKHWWPQAEAIVGFVGAYQESEDLAFLDAAVAAWDFTKRHIRDAEYGEWRGRVSREGEPYDDPKLDPWKCPYHNARACLETIARADAMAAAFTSS
ncbi:MAG: AGE family epimerase/isomerase [Bacteroidota bacterium]